MPGSLEGYQRLTPPPFPSGSGVRSWAPKSRPLSAKFRVPTPFGVQARLPRLQRRPLRTTSPGPLTSMVSFGVTSRNCAVQLLPRFGGGGEA